MKMPKSHVTLLWQPLIMLVLGVIAALLNPSHPVLDVITNVAGGLLLFSALLFLLIDTRQDLT